LVSILTNTKKFEFDIVKPMGGYFLAVGILKSLHKVNIKYYYPTKGVPENEKREFISSIEEWETLDEPELSTDVAFANFLIDEHGLGTIPGSGFYSCHNKTLK